MREATLVPSRKWNGGQGLVGIVIRLGVIDPDALKKEMVSNFRLKTTIPTELST